MDKQQVQNIIRETFENPFDKDRFTRFIKNLLNHIDEGSFTYQGTYIPEKFRTYIKTLERIGKFSDGENSLDILVITLQKETSLERARTMQRNFIAWYLNGSRGGEMKDAALVAYVSPEQADWRFSLVKMDYKFEKTASGKVKVKEEFTPARRWSFLVGVNEKSHTAQSRLVNILANDEQAPTLAELENSFDIEIVTKEFFLKYRELFLRTKEALDEVVEKDPKIKADFKARGVDTVNFAKKLLGQIVFLYFLQKKGWFGVGRADDWGTGSKHFLRRLFAGAHGSYKNFFNDILELLFYDALRRDRSEDDHYYPHFNCKIPFLNGGLFDPIGLNGGYDWTQTDICLPDKLFSNKDKTKEGDIGDGILDVFDRYNFTVREDEPLEKEVAIDPELLGKAYEKFNAIRPDNFDEFTKALKSGKKGEENKFNKKFGVYYTPREIVHYMCQQSLINYLYTQAEEAGLSSAIKKQDIEDLIEVGELITEHEATALIKQEKIKNGIQKSTEYTALLDESIRENAAAIDKWLEEITVCDPAVGSGAFPVGMMNEIVRARNVLSVFLNDRKRNDYESKRRCIEHSLYGVDIDPGAVEIAKLRLWLSLVVDEDDIKDIKPLPNLDYRIMQGNSLISEFMGINFDVEPRKEDLLFKDETDELIEKFQKKKDEFLNEFNVAKKTKLKEQVENLLIKIFETKLKTQRTDYFNRLKEIERKYSVLPNEEQRKELIRQEKEKLYKEFGFDLESAENQLKEFISGRKIKPFFLWNIYFSEVFHEKGGFDVMIANPPYINTYSIPKRDKLFLNNNFHTAYKKYDIYVLFFEKGLTLLKESGILSYITSNKYFSQPYGYKLRNLLLQNTIKEIINFRTKVFEATVDTAINITQKQQPSDEGTFKLLECKKPDEIFYLNELPKVNFPYHIFIKMPENNFRITLTDNKIKLIEKIQNHSYKVSDICYVNYGCRLVSKAGKKKKNDYIFSKKENPNLKPFIEGQDVQKYRIISSRWVNYSPSEHYLSLFKELFENKKIVAKDIVGRNGVQIALDKDMFYNDHTVINAVNWHLLKDVNYKPVKKQLTEIKISISKNFEPEFLLGILNSKLLKFYFYELFNIDLHFYPATFQKMPIPIIDINTQKPFISIVDKTLEDIKADDYSQNPTKQAQVSEYERQIDQMVYELYGLTEEEIKIVEECEK